MRWIARLAISISALCLSACGGGGGAATNAVLPHSGAAAGASAGLYSVTVIPPSIDHVDSAGNRFPCGTESPVALLNDRRIVYKTDCVVNGVDLDYSYIYDMVSGNFTPLPPHIQRPQRANQHADVAAFFFDAGGTRAARYLGATCLIDKELPPTSALFDINAAGTAVGFADPHPYSSCESHPATCPEHRAIALTLSGSIVPLDPVARFGEAYSINDSGTALGIIFDAATQSLHSAIFPQAGAPIDLTAMITTNERGGSPQFLRGYRINALGHAIVTEAFTPPVGRQTIHVFETYFYNGTTMQKITPLAGDTTTFMADLNNNDTAVGMSCRDVLETTASCRAVLYRNGTLTPLADLLPAPYNTALRSGNLLNPFLQSAISINDAGQIAINVAIGFGNLTLIVMTPP